MYYYRHKFEPILTEMFGYNIKYHTSGSFSCGYRAVIEEPTAKDYIEAGERVPDEGSSEWFCRLINKNQY